MPRRALATGIVAACVVAIAIVGAALIANSSDDAEAEGAAPGSCGDNLTWEISDGTLKISGTGAMYDYTNMALHKIEWALNTVQIERNDAGSIVFTPAMH